MKLKIEIIEHAEIEGEAIYGTRSDVFIRFEHPKVGLRGSWFNRENGKAAFPHGVKINPAELTLEKIGYGEIGK